MGFKSLIERGFRIEPLPYEIGWFKKYLVARAPDREAVVTVRCGWLNSKMRHYVLPDRIVGGPRDKLIHYSGSVEGFARLGSLPQWRRHVAELACGNSRLMFAIMVPLAAPLAKLVGEQSGGFHLHGKSSSGKTMALHLAASVHGAQVKTWRATENGIEASCVMHSDGCLLLDEIHMADPKLVAEVVYQAMNGTGKARMTADRRAEPSANWIIMLLSSGENPLADYIASGTGAKAIVQARQQVRIVDIRADAGAGLGIFDELPRGFGKPAEAADALREAAGKFRGHALPAFVRGLIERSDFPRLAAQINRERRLWVQSHVQPDADGQVIRVAQRFALVAAAGRLSVELDILPWAPSDIDWAVKEVFHAWLAARGNQGPAEVNAVTGRLRELIARHGASRFQRLADMPSLDSESKRDERERVIDRAGFVRPGEREYLIFPEIWQREILRGVDSGVVHEVLLKGGVLRGDSQGKASTPVKIDGKSKRFYAVDIEALDREPLDGTEV
jgi:putative DNA primase/helicase